MYIYSIYSIYSMFKIHIIHKIFSFFAQPNSLGIYNLQQIRFQVDVQNPHSPRHLRSPEIWWILFHEYQDNIESFFFKRLGSYQISKLHQGPMVSVHIYVWICMCIYIYIYIWVYSIQELITVFQNDEALGIHKSSLQCFIEVMHFS